MAVHHDRLDSGPDLVVHAGEALEDRTFATSLGELDDASALGVGQHGVKVEALLEGALVDRQHTSWDDRAGEEFVEDVVLDGLTDALVRHHLAPGDVGGGLIARRLEQETPEAVGDRAPAGDLGMAFATGALAIAAGKPALGPQQHDRMAAGPVPDAARVGGVRDDVERSAVVAGGSQRRRDLVLEHALDDLTVADLEAVELEWNTDTIAHGGLPSSGFVTEEARETLRLYSGLPPSFQKNGNASHAIGVSRVSVAGAY